MLFNIKRQMCDSDKNLTGVKDKVKAFQDIVNSAGDTPIYALFKQEWCGACKAFKPTFLKYRNLCQQSGSNAIMIMVDGDSASELFEAYGIHAYPTTLVFQRRKIIKKIEGSDNASLACAMKIAGLQLTKEKRQKRDNEYYY